MPGGEVGLDVEVGKEDKEDKSMGEHVVRELQREGTIVVEDLKIRESLSYSPWNRNRRKPCLVLWLDPVYAQINYPSTNTKKMWRHFWMTIIYTLLSNAVVLINQFL